MSDIISSGKRARSSADLATMVANVRAADKYNQARHALSVALRASTVAIGDLVVCAMGCDVYPGEGDLVVLTDVDAGLGARHVAAASVTAHTTATAVVVSATDGNVRAFAGGQLVLQLDPDVPHSPTSREEA
jgi:hypothetical protein